MLKIILILAANGPIRMGEDAIYWARFHLILANMQNIIAYGTFMRSLSHFYLITTKKCLKNSVILDQKLSAIIINPSGMMI